MKARLSRDLPMHNHTPSSLDPVVNEFIALGEILKDVHLYRIVDVNNEMFDIFRQTLPVFKRENGYNVGDTSLFQRIFLLEGT